MTLFQMTLNATFIQRAISPSREVDENGVTTSGYTNLNGSYDIRLYALLSRALLPHSKTEFSGTVAVSSNPSLFNTQVNKVRTGNYAPGITFVYFRDTTFSIRYATGATLATSKQSLFGQSTLYQALQQTLYSEWQYSGRFRISTSANWNIRQGIAGTGMPNTFIWNAQVIFDALKNRSFSISLTAKDILNNNKGFMRWTQDERVYVNTYSVRSRYLLFSAIWHFTHT